MMPTLSDDERVVTRYSEYEQIPALLVKDCDSTGRKARLILVDGTRVTAEADVRDWPTTVALHNNLVNVPRYWLDRPLPRVPPYLQPHLYGSVVVFQIGPDCSLIGSNTRPLGYDDQKGVYKIENAPQWQEVKPDELDW